jgi:hypothetical protein
MGYTISPIWLLINFISSCLAMTSYMESVDLTSFVTRPELRVPRLILTKHRPKLIAPGYIFMAPYIRAEDDAYSKYYQPCQIGPAIYDLEGNLVWSGACIFSNRNTFDFKVNRDRGNATVLSMIVGPIRKDFGENGTVVVLSASLEVQYKSTTTSDILASYMHEFSVFDGGDIALELHAEYREANVTEVSRGNRTRWTVRDEGFRETDLQDGSVRFSWWAMDHVPIEETFDRPPLLDPGTPHYDPYHINSIEKTAFGRYIISMRHTNTVYMISGQDGHIVWRLGGARSSFVQVNPFTFSAQHDARILSEHTNGTIIMSLFDNAGATGRPKQYFTANVSSVLILELETAAEPKTVQLLRKYDQPDHGMTTLRGNAQVLPDGNVFAGWSNGGHIAEFAANGDLLLSGSLLSNRMSTYRTFKFGIDEVKLFPTEPISLICRTLEIPDSFPTRKLSIMYVSWNAATEVARWEFAATQEDGPMARFTVIGLKDKHGFETVAKFNEGGKFAIVHALDRDGKLLGKAAPVRCEDLVAAANSAEQSLTGSHADLKLYQKPPGLQPGQRL